jgi:hypothetical protein
MTVDHAVNDTNSVTESTTRLVTKPTVGPLIEHADALTWLPRQGPGCAVAIVFDPPYSVGTPVRGREDGAAGSVFDPLSFLYDTLPLCARVLRPGGIVIMFTDWRRMCDMGRAATMSGLRPAGCVAWVRNRPGTGALFRSSWDPIMVFSRGTADAVDRAAIRNVVVADYPARRTHPYEKPAAVYEHILARVCRAGRPHPRSVRRIGQLPRRRGEAGPAMAGSGRRPAVRRDLVTGDRLDHPAIRPGQPY